VASTRSAVRCFHATSDPPIRGRDSAAFLACDEPLSWRLRHGQAKSLKSPSAAPSAHAITDLLTLVPTDDRRLFAVGQLEDARRLLMGGCAEPLDCRMQGVTGAAARTGQANAPPYGRVLLYLEDIAARGWWKRWKRPMSCTSKCSAPGMICRNPRGWTGQL
jgi:hypothetical protein